MWRRFTRNRRRVAARIGGLSTAEHSDARAQQLFTQHGIEVVVGVSADDPGQAGEAYVKGTLTTTGEVCDDRNRSCHRDQ